VLRAQQKGLSATMYRYLTVTELHRLVVWTDKH
jgi:hypothetical protein